MIDTQAIRQRWESVGSKLDERGRRLFAAGEVRTAGWGGLEAVSEITGLARSTIGRGLKDLDPAPLLDQRTVEPAAIEAEVDHVRSLGIDALRTRWRQTFGAHHRA